MTFDPRLSPSGPYVPPVVGPPGPPGPAGPAGPPGAPGPPALAYFDRSIAELTATGIAFERILVATAGAELGFDLTGWVDGSTLRARLDVGLFATAGNPDVVFQLVLVRTSGNLVSLSQSAATFTTNAPVSCVVPWDFPAIGTEATLQLRAEWLQVGAGTRSINPAAAIPTFAALSAWMIPPP